MWEVLGMQPKPKHNLCPLAPRSAGRSPSQGFGFSVGTGTSTLAPKAGQDCKALSCCIFPGGPGLLLSLTVAIIPGYCSSFPGLRENCFSVVGVAVICFAKWVQASSFLR